MSASPTQKTLGPISDLERHLPPEWWRSLFNALYLKTDGDVTETLSTLRFLGFWCILSSCG